MPVTTALRILQRLRRPAVRRGPAHRDDAVHQLMDGARFTVLYQPVVDLADGSLLAYECIARPEDGLFPGAEAMVAAAVRARRMGELGRAIRRAATAGCPDHALFVNVDPAELDEAWLVQPDDPIFFHDHPIYLEITESAPLHYFEQCRGVLAEVRGKGVGLVIDDLGSGYSNLRYIADLAPALVKLDRSLVEGIAEGNARFRLVRSIASLCAEMGAMVVAEGIESPEQLLCSRLAGVRYGQGFLLGRPSPRPEPPAWPPGVSFAPRTRLRIVSDLPADTVEIERSSV